MKKEFMEPEVEVVEFEVSEVVAAEPTSEQENQFDWGDTGWDKE